MVYDCLIGALRALKHKIINFTSFFIVFQNTASNSMVESVPSSYAIDDTNKWGWITLYIVTIVIAILGNLLFIVSSLCTKRTRTTGK